MLLTLGAGGCTRTYDGSIVPAYEMVPAAGQPVGWFDMKPADTLPPSRLYKFPPAPPPPPEEKATTRSDRPPPRIRAGRLIPKLDGQIPRAVTCRDETIEGRVRVVCL